MRISWDEAQEIVAAAHVHAIKEYGPDRVAGFSPIPAMSMVSHAVGARFISLIGGSMLSFYDWYADLPVASPQMFGDQTDVPESGDWWDASYLMMWGSNVPVTRTPDAHWMAEARYRGQKVVVVSPDYADNVKFADEWLPAQPGTDGALAMAMGHVILKEFFVEKATPRFVDYVSRYTDLPYLIALEPVDGGGYRPGKFVTAADLGETDAEAAFRPVLWDAATDAPAVPNGSLGHRYAEAGVGRWNLDLGAITPRLSCAGGTPVELILPRFDNDVPDLMRRGVPTAQVAGKLVTTVFDLMLAQYGVSRPGLPGQWPAGYDDPSEPYTPAWQEPITGVPAAAVARIAREFADNAERSGGRSMILMGAGTNHWFHSDTTYRAMLALTTLTGCQGVNGGGWAHYVGQEKCRPVTGWAHLAFGLDWSRPPRQMIGTAFWYLHTDQWRYDQYGADVLSSPLGPWRVRRQAHRGPAGQVGAAGLDAVDAHVRPQPARRGRRGARRQSGRPGCARRAGARRRAAGVRLHRSGRAAELAARADGLAGQPSRLLGQGQRVLPAPPAGHRLLPARGRGAAGETARRRCLARRGAAGQARSAAVAGLPDDLDHAVLRRGPAGRHLVREARPEHHRHAPVHPRVHPGDQPAVADPHRLRPRSTASPRRSRSSPARTWAYARTWSPRRCCMTPPTRWPHPAAWCATGRPARRPRCPARPCRSSLWWNATTATIAEKMAALGPLLDRLGTTTKAVTVDVNPEIDYLHGVNGTVRGGAADGRPRLDTDIRACEAILALSGTTNGRVATEGFHFLERRTGQRLADLAAEHEGKQIRFADCQSRPVPVITSPEWSGSEHGGRRYSPFTINVERLKPWHTLTGRQHFYLDHDWMQELGEELPLFRPPLDMHKLFGEPRLGRNGELELTVRYLTPHSKWSIHSEYQDNLIMLTLSRGGPTMWMSEADAAKIGVADNEWIEAVNRNGVVVCRAVVTHKMPEGTVYLYHAQERVIDVPKAESNGRRGGIHNSLTRLLIKPSHIIGGYAQLSFAFNYLGPTGNQRDEVTVIRRRSQEVQY